MDDAQWRLQAFPGPLTPSVPRDKVHTPIDTWAYMIQPIALRHACHCAAPVVKDILLSGGSVPSPGSQDI